LLLVFCFSYQGNTVWQTNRLAVHLTVVGRHQQNRHAAELMN